MICQVKTEKDTIRMKLSYLGHSFAPEIISHAVLAIPSVPVELSIFHHIGVEQIPVSGPNPSLHRNLALQAGFAVPAPT